MAQNNNMNNMNNINEMTENNKINCGRGYITDFINNLFKNEMEICYREHKTKFNKSLKLIREIRQKHINEKYSSFCNMLLRDFQWSKEIIYDFFDGDYEIIEFVFEGTYRTKKGDLMNYDAGNNIINITKWKNIKSKDLFNDLLYNYMDYKNNWENYEDFKEEIDAENIETDWGTYAERNKRIWNMWENMKYISMVFDDLLKEFDLCSEDFVEWIGENI